MTNAKRVIKLNPKWWLTGRNNSDFVENSCLLHPASGRMCCLGYDALDRGVDPRDLMSIGYSERYMGITTPERLAVRNEFYDKSIAGELTKHTVYNRKDFDPMYSDHTMAAKMLMGINDDTVRFVGDPAARVAALNAVCLEHNLSFTFELEID